MVCQISTELAKRGHEVVVYTSDARDFNSRLKPRFRKIDGVSVFYIKNLSMFSVSKSKLFITPQLIPLIEKEGWAFDIIHLHEYRTFQNLVVARYAKAHGIPYVFQAHGSLPKIGRQSRKWVFDAFFGFRLLKDASMTIALTRAERHQLRRMGVPEEKIALIPNGLDLSQYAFLPAKGSFRKKHNIPENRKIILYLGRIHEIKGIDILVKAYSYAKKTLRLNNAVLVICGSDDGYLGELENLLVSLGLTHDVLLTGPLFGKNKLEAYQDSDIFVLPSRYETFPNVVLEAYGCSKPVIASNVESMSDIVLDGITGFLFEANDVKRLAELLINVLSNEKEAEKMGKTAREFVERNFSIERVVDSFEVLFRDSLKKIERSQKYAQI